MSRAAASGTNFYNGTDSDHIGMYKRQDAALCRGDSTSSWQRSVMGSPTLSSSLVAQGFHLTLSTTVEISSWRPYHDCAFHLLLDLDPHLYVDQYEIVQRPGYTSLLWGATDLERPVSAVGSGSSVLLLTADKSLMTREHATNFTLDIPLHARYGRPALTTRAAIHHVDLQHPIGFFACSDDSV